MRVFTAAGMGTSVIIDIPVNDGNKGVAHESQNPAGR
jgi:hypothetical protein